MKLTWTKWSALPAAVLIAGSVAMAQDQPALSSQPAPPAQNASAATPATPATTPAPRAKPKSKPTVTQSKENQQDRIAQGVKTPPSAVRSAFERRQLNGQQSQLFRQMYKDNQEKGINQQVKMDRAANGWKLTTSEKQRVYKQQVNKQQVNKQQDVASKSIYNKKHNAKTQPQAKPQQ
jgi:hypothetical protein